MKKIKIISFLIGSLTIVFIINAVVNHVFALNDDKKVNKVEGFNAFSSEETNDLSWEYVVVLDAGHGGYDSGSSSNDEMYLEKDIVLDITLQLGELLEDEGIKVVYTRDSDEVDWPSNNKQDLASRVAISNANPTALFLSLHLNYYENSDINGFETWVDQSDENAVEIAQLIQQHLSLLDYSYDRGIKDEDENPLYVISNNYATSALVELGFITSDHDLNYLVSEEGSNQIASALKSAIVNYLNQ